jgi:hypothetical protein
MSPLYAIDTFNFYPENSTLLSLLVQETPLNSKTPQLN